MTVELYFAPGACSFVPHTHSKPFAQPPGVNSCRNWSSCIRAST